MSSDITTEAVKKNPDQPHSSALPKQDLYDFQNVWIWSFTVRWAQSWSSKIPTGMEEFTSLSHQNILL